jgi:hypothetical protein
MSPLTRRFAFWHLCFVPAAIYVLACDLGQPELWDSWYRNPAVAVPYCLCLELAVALAFAYGRRQQRRRLSGIPALPAALRPPAEGNATAAEADARQDRKSLRIKQAG